ISGLTKTTALDGRKYDIACGQIDVGNAETPLTERMTKGVPQANGQTMVEPVMAVDNVAKAVVYMASLPLDANVLFMTVMATKMPDVGRGYPASGIDGGVAPSKALCPGRRRHESVADFHPPAGGHGPADCRNPAGRRARLPPATGLRPPPGRLPHDPDRHLLPGRQPRRHGLVGDDAPRAPVRPITRAQADDVYQLLRRLAHPAAVHHCVPDRRGRAAGAGRHQRRLGTSAQGPAQPARL